MRVLIKIRDRNQLTDAFIQKMEDLGFIVEIVSGSMLELSQDQIEDADQVILFDNGPLTDSERANLALLNKSIAKVDLSISATDANDLKLEFLEGPDSPISEELSDVFEDVISQKPETKASNDNPETKLEPAVPPKTTKPVASTKAATPFDPIAPAVPPDQPKPALDLLIPTMTHSAVTRTPKYSTISELTSKWENLDTNKINKRSWVTQLNKIPRPAYRELSQKQDYIPLAFIGAGLTLAAAAIEMYAKKHGWSLFTPVMSLFKAFPTPIGNIDLREKVTPLDTGRVTSFAPNSVKPGATNNAIYIYVHNTESSKDVLEDRPRGPDRGEKKQSGFLELAGLEIGDLIDISIQPSADTPLEFKRSRESIRWGGTHTHACFRFDVRHDAAVQEFELTFVVESRGILLGRLITDITVSKSDLLSPQVSNNTRKGKGFNYIFMSYDSRDSYEVDIVSQAYKARDQKHFIDRQSIVNGWLWKRTLKKEIKKSDAFQLFWSRNARSSKYVNKELKWFRKHKKKQKQNNFSIPNFIPIEVGDSPISPPKGFSAHQFPKWGNREKKKGPSKQSPGTEFQDEIFAPVMVVLPLNSFKRGSITDDARNRDEAPVMTVSIQNKFAASKFQITFDEWEYARGNGFHHQLPAHDGMGRRRMPVINITWHQARDYVAWLSQQTDQNYRLLSEAEWEYCCRAGTETPFPFGESITNTQANFDGRMGFRGKNKSGFLEHTWPVDTKLTTPNKFGLVDMVGNVWDWVEDDYFPSYDGAPTDGSARIGSPRSKHRVLRGGGFRSGANNLRSARRGKAPIKPRNGGVIGFRIARDIRPDE